MTTTQTTDVFVALRSAEFALVGGFDADAALEDAWRNLERMPADRLARDEAAVIKALAVLGDHGRRISSWMVHHLAPQLGDHADRHIVWARIHRALTS